MNKDEMIEEMAKVLCDNDKRCEECISRLLLPCGYKSYCTKLYDAGYRKVTEDEIVESMKTYERARQETARKIIDLIVDESGVDLLGGYYKLPFHTYNKIKREYGVNTEEDDIELD